MRRLLIGLAAMAVLSNGCDMPTAPLTHSSEPDVQAVRTIDDASIRGGILRQCTVFPYHFETGTPRLNGLGLVTVAVLTDRFRETPGTLNIRRGDAPAELYRQRVQNVLMAMERGGVPARQIRVTDAPAAGDGLPGEQVLTVMKLPPLADNTAPGSGLPGSGTGGTK